MPVLAIPELRSLRVGSSGEEDQPGQVEAELAPSEPFTFLEVFRGAAGLSAAMVDLGGGMLVDLAAGRPEFENADVVVGDPGRLDRGCPAVQDLLSSSAQ